MKTKLVISAIVMMLSLGVVTAQNQKTDKEKVTTTQQKSPRFIDKNNNDICDNFENGTPSNKNANGKQRLLDGSGPRKGNAQGVRDGRGRYVNRSANPKVTRRYNRQNNQIGLRNGKGGVANFVDENNDGICDRKQKN